MTKYSSEYELWVCPAKQTQKKQKILPANNAKKTISNPHHFKIGI